METTEKVVHPDQNFEELNGSPKGEIDALLQASDTAQDSVTALEYAQRAIDVQPDDPKVQQCVQRSIFSALHQDAFVAFVAETDKHYVITFRNSRPLIVAKARKQPEIFPTSKLTKGERGEFMILWLLLGLLPVGIGALILSPLTVGHAIDILWQQHSDTREKRLAWITIFLASILGVLGMIFTLLLVLHLIG